MNTPTSIVTLLLISVATLPAQPGCGEQRSESGIRHSFLIAGNRSVIVGEKNEIVWETEGSSRDGFVLENGNVLISQGSQARELTRDGGTVWSYQLSAGNKELGTAVRLKNGNTLVNLTHGNQTVEFDAAGKIAWHVTNKDVSGRFADPCGGQRLASGNTLICNYGQKDGSKPKLMEITPGKKVVWEYFHPTIRAHEIHVLTTNGKPEGALK